MSDEVEWLQRKKVIFLNSSPVLTLLYCLPNIANPTEYLIERQLFSIINRAWHFNRADLAIDGSKASIKLFDAGKRLRKSRRKTAASN